MRKRLLARLLAAALVVESVFQCVGTLPVRAEGDILIDEAHFPDAEFRTIMKQRYDTNHDGYLNEQERGVYNVVCEGNKNVKSMEGIEYFPEVRGIWCKDCDLDSLDLSRNKKVTGVWCSGNPRITSLSFRENKELEWVYCHDCDLTSLDVTQNKKLAYLECNTNERLGSLDVTNNRYLEHLTCGTCGLSELDLTNCTILTHLDAFQNNFKTLDLTHNTQLKRLDIWNNPRLGNMDISIFPDLEYYNCASNGVTELDVSHNKSLMMLNCAWNSISKLDLTQNHRLAWLRALSNPISELDLSGNPQLYFCQVVDTGITTLDISHNTRLIKIVKEGSIDRSEYDGRNDDWVIDYGGSTDYFDDLRYWFIAGNNVTVLGVPEGDAKYVDNGDPEYYDSFINTDDGASGDLVTRGEAIQTLYELAGRPGSDGSGASRFDDLNGEFYEAAAIWGAEEKIALGYPNVYSNTFAGDKPISKQDLALMVHRYAQAYGYDSAYDYGRTDHFKDSLDIDFYAWGAYTYAIQWEIMPIKGEYIYPHGRATTAEFEAGLKNFTDHVGISRTVSVCTSGGSGTLTEQDKNDRHYTNHSESLEPSNPEPEEPGVQNEQIAAFVERMYNVCLGRESDAAGKDGWVKNLEDGFMDGADTAEAFVFSREMLEKNLSNKEFVTTLYNCMMGREPEEAGLEGWVTALEYGVLTRYEVTKSFVESDEFTEICSEYGIRRGRFDASVAPIERFVSRFYKLCLERGADQSGLYGWVGQLKLKNMTGADISESFFFSDEMNRRNLSDEKFVELLYKTMMDRDADILGRAGWVEQLSGGYMTRREVLGSFVRSVEFSAICKLYGIERGSL